MKQTTLCYLERDGQYLMLHRVKKEHDENHDKWIGVGGKFEDKESPEDCVCREVLEETGLMWIDKRKLAALQQWEGDRIFLKLMDAHVPFFSLKLVYAGDTLMEAVLNGERIR